MLVIRRPQLDVLGVIPRLQFEQEMETFLLRHFPFEARHADLPRWVHEGLDAATGQGLTSRYEASLYLSLMAMLGAGFDRDPQLPWVAAALSRPAHATRERIDRVFDAAVSFLEETGGPKCAWLVRAKLRFRRLDVTAFDRSTRSRAIPEQVHALLAGLYPQKAARLGPRALRRLVKDAAEAARSRGAPRASSTVVQAVHAFMLGSGFETDPCFPWMAATLQDDSFGTPDERCLHMHALTLDFVERSFDRPH